MAKFKAGALNSILKEFDIKTQAKVEKGIKIAVVGTWGGIIESTPVDTGRARGNWFVTTGKPSKQSSNRKSKNKGSNYVRNNLGDVLKQKHYLTNNLPYIKSLEYGVHEAATVSSHRVKAHTRKVKGTTQQVKAHTRGSHSRGAYRTTAHRMVRGNLRYWRQRLKAAFKGLA